jgi:hypothetical protein
MAEALRPYHRARLRAPQPGPDGDTVKVASWITRYNRASQHPTVYVIEGKQILFIGMRSRGVFWILSSPCTC